MDARFGERPSWTGPAPACSFLSTPSFFFFLHGLVGRIHSSEDPRRFRWKLRFPFPAKKPVNFSCIVRSSTSFCTSPPTKAFSYKKDEHEMHDWWQRQMIHTTKPRGFLIRLSVPRLTWEDASPTPHLEIPAESAFRQIILGFLPRCSCIGWPALGFEVL